MALCSSVELLLPTYFMTSGAPHATLLLLDNSTSTPFPLYGDLKVLLYLLFVPALPVSVFFI